jgi:hypothetical protein
MWLTHTTSDRIEPGDVVTIEANVVDKRFVELNDATAVATVTRPGGMTMTVLLQWTGERDGQYRGTFSTEAGAYEISVDATCRRPSCRQRGLRERGERSGAFDLTMYAAPSSNREETGGKSATTDTAKGVAEDVRYAGRGVTSVEERELWNMPIVLIALMGLVCAEWGYRRAVGLQ